MKELRKLLEANTGSGRLRVSDVFRDFVELLAITFRNSADPVGWATRESRYLEVAGRYDHAELDRFAHALALLHLALEDEMGDVLGELYMSLALGNDRLGQFFTPYSVSLLSAKLSVADRLDELKDRDAITMQEPSCGSGGMVIAFAQVLREAGIDYQRVLRVSATDVDATAVHMTYVHLTLLGIPAEVVHGNTLTQEVTNVWRTPALILAAAQADTGDADAPAASTESAA